MCAVFSKNIDIKPFMWYHKYIKIQNTQFLKIKSAVLFLRKMDLYKKGNFK